MTFLDTALDKTLAGYTKLGASARGIDATERFEEVAGEHVMVTGATGGIGKATALRLADNGAFVHAVGRNSDKLAALVAEGGDRIIPHQADLSSMDAIAKLAADYVTSGYPLHALVNNVGVMSAERTVTPEGFELSYATNLLGQYLLTELLMPTLKASSPSRVVFVASGGMYSQPLTVSNIQSSEGEYNGTAAYARTKRGQVVLAELLADELEDGFVFVNSMHPGWVDTEGVRSSLPTFRKITGPFLRDEAQGADTIVWLAAAEEAVGQTGKFFHDRAARPTHRMKKTEASDAKRHEFYVQLKMDAAPWLPDAMHPGATTSTDSTDTNGDT